jgi:hypothetical protein
VINVQYERGVYLPAQAIRRDKNTDAIDTLAYAQQLAKERAGDPAD